MTSGSPEEPPKAPLEAAEVPDSDASTLPARPEEDISAAKDADKVLKDVTDSGSGTSTSAKPPAAAAPAHPRDGLQRWRWPMMLFGNLVLTLIGGYDTSNAANVQVPIYQAFGHIELLPWIGLTYSMVSVAMIPLARKLTGIFEMRALSVAAAVLVIAGSALAGAAPNISSVIAGRAIMGVGSIILYQAILTWNVVFSKPHELPLVQAVVGAVYAIGLISGPVVGGAFAENEHATWRWAFYIVIPFTAVSVLLMAFYPTFRIPSSKSTLAHIKEIDWLGSLLWIGIFVTLGLGCIFSGATWAWGSGPSIAVWTLLGVFLACFLLQQSWCVLTVPERRAFPVHLLGNRAVSCTTLCALCAAMGYGPTLYYTPIYFGFTRGHGALAAAVRLLPFIGAFIGTIFVAGGLMPAVRYYKIFFLVGPIFILVGGGLLQTVNSQSSESRVMGFQAIVGLGLGTVWQLALPITSAILPPQHRLDAVAMFNMAQNGGVAVSLMLAGAVYQNVGFHLVSAVVEGQDFSSHDIRELLSGTDSPITVAHEPAMLAHIVDAVIETILRCYYLIIAAGAICLIGGCCMKFEALELRKKPKTRQQASEDREKGESS